MLGGLSYKQKYKNLKRKLKLLIYEQECFLEELRKCERKMIKVQRDKNFLLDRLLQYEKVEDSSPDSDNTISSDESDSDLKPVKQERRDSPSGMNNHIGLNGRSRHYGGLLAGPEGILGGMPGYLGHPRLGAPGGSGMASMVNSGQLAPRSRGRPRARGGGTSTSGGRGSSARGRGNSAGAGNVQQAVGGVMSGNPRLPGNMPLPGGLSDLSSPSGAMLPAGGDPSLSFNASGSGGSNFMFQHPGQQSEASSSSALGVPPQGQGSQEQQIFSTNLFESNDFLGGGMSKEDVDRCLQDATASVPLYRMVDRVSEGLPADIFSDNSTEDGGPTGGGTGASSTASSIEMPSQNAGNSTATPAFLQQ